MDSKLQGPMVPDWFKELSDGCSVPLPARYRFIYEHNARVACYIHDYEYFHCRKLWNNYVMAKHHGAGKTELRFKKSRWKMARKVADQHFRENIQLAWKRGGHRITMTVGWAMSVVYWAGVRVGGRDGAKKGERDHVLLREERRSELRKRVHD